MIKNSGNGNGSINQILIGVAALVAIVAGLAAFIAPIHAELSMDREVRAVMQTSFTALVEKLHEDGTKAAYNSGRVDTEIKAIKIAAVDLDTRLQREYHLVTDTVEAKLTGLDTRLQKEIASTSALLSISIEDNKHALEKSQDFQAVNREVIAGIGARLSAIEAEAKSNRDRLIDIKR